MVTTTTATRAHARVCRDERRMQTCIHARHRHVLHSHCTAHLRYSITTSQCTLHCPPASTPFICSPLAVGRRLLVDGVLQYTTAMRYVPLRSELFVVTMPNQCTSSPWCTSRITLGSKISLGSVSTRTAPVDNRCTARSVAMTPTSRSTFDFARCRRRVFCCFPAAAHRDARHCSCPLEAEDANKAAGMTHQLSAASASDDAPAAKRAGSLSGWTTAVPKYRCSRNNFCCSVGIPCLKR